MSEQKQCHCLHCGSKMEDIISTDGLERPHCTGCGYTHYFDPKVAVGAIVRDVNGRILMIQRDIEPSRGLWTFPGGYVDRFEVPAQAAVRELHEETGVTIELDELQGVYQAEGSAVLLLVYLAHLTSDSPFPMALHECQDCRYYLPEEIPWDQLAFSTTKAALEDALAGRTRRLASLV